MNPNQSTMIKKVSRVILGAFFLLLILAVIAGLVLQLPWIQTELIHRITQKLSDQGLPEISINRVKLHPLNGLVIEEALLRDRFQDTFVYVERLSTDFNWLINKNRPLNIENIQIYKPYVKLYIRKNDSVNNIYKLFESKKEGSRQKKITQQNKPKDAVNPLEKIHFGHLDLHQGRFINIDANTKSSINISVVQISAEVGDHLYENDFIGLDKLHFIRPEIHIEDQPNNAPKNDPYLPKYFTFPFLIHANEVKLSQGKFTYNNFARPQQLIPNQVNMANLSIDNVEITTGKYLLSKTMMLANFKHIGMKERSGIEIIDAKSIFSMNSQRLYLDKFKLKTRNSNLLGQIHMDYRHANELLRFNKAVDLHTNISPSTLALQDIAYFVPALSKMAHNTFEFQGKAQGLLDELQLNDLVARTSQNIAFNIEDAKVSNLVSPEIGLAIAGNQVEMHTNVTQFKEFLGISQIPPNLYALGDLHYSGSYSGDFQKFTLDGNLKSPILHADLAQFYLDLTQPENPIYKGDIDFYHFQVQKLYPDVPITDMILKANLDGRGIEKSNFNTLLKGKFQKIIFNNQALDEIAFNGFLNSKNYSGEIKSSDENLSIIAKGDIDFRDQENPKYDLVIEHAKVNLKHFNVSKKPYVLDFQAYGEFEGHNIDDIEGKFFLKDIHFKLLETSKEFNIDNVVIKSQLQDEFRNIAVESKEIKGNMVGFFKFKEVQKALQQYFLQYLEFKPPASIPQLNKTDIIANFSIVNFSEVWSIFDDKIKKLDTLSLYMDLNGNKSQLNLDARLSHAKYDNFTINHINIFNEGNIQGLNSKLLIDSVYFLDKLSIFDLDTRINSLENKTLDIDFQMMPKEHPQYLKLKANLSKNSDAYLLQLKEQFANKLTWDIDKQNQIAFYNKTNKLWIDDLNFRKDSQLIKIQSEDINNIVFDFDKVSIKELITGFFPNIDYIFGQVTGKIKVNDILGNVIPQSDLLLNDMSVNNRKIGNLMLKSTYNKDNLDVFLTNFDIENTFKVYGRIDNFSSTKDLNLKFNTQNINLNIFQPYIGELLIGLQGKLTSDLNISGTMNKPNINGLIDLRSVNFSLFPIYSRYRIDSLVIQAKNNSYEFIPTKVYDQRDSTAIIRGMIHQKNTKDFLFDLAVSSDNIQCLNSTSKDNESFYGQVNASLNASIKGDLDNLVVDIKAKNKKNSEVTLVFNDMTQLQKDNFYKFKVVNTQNLKPNSIEKLKKLALNMDFDINRDCAIKLLLNPATEDNLSCQGVGRIAVTKETNKDMRIIGNYEINSGTYLFTYYNFIQRVFYLNEGGKITFTGDVDKSLIDLSATFRTRANSYDLVKSFYGNSDDQNLSSSAQNVMAKINLYLRNKLSNPDLRYEIDIDQTNPTLQSVYDNIIRQTKLNEYELSRQVMGLLVFKRFMTPSTNGLDTRPVDAGDISNMAYDFVTSKLSGYVNDLISESVSGMNVEFNYRNFRQGLTNFSNLEENRNEIKVAISQRFLDDRLVFNAGGNYNFGANNINSNNTQGFLGGDFDVEYLINPSGSFRAKAYTNFNNDPLNSKYINKTGVGVLFRKDFDRLSDFFKKNKEKE